MRHMAEFMQHVKWFTAARNESLSFLQRSFSRGIYGWEGSRADGRTMGIAELCELTNHKLLLHFANTLHKLFIATVVPVELLGAGVCINAHLAAQADIVVMTEGSHAGFATTPRGRIHTNARTHTPRQSCTLWTSDGCPLGSSLVLPSRLKRHPHSTGTHTLAHTHARTQASTHCPRTHAQPYSNK